MGERGSEGPPLWGREAVKGPVVGERGSEGPLLWGREAVKAPVRVLPL